jgi:hypothetical protein
LQHGTDDGLSLAACVGAIAAPDLAVHDRRFQRLLGAMVRGRDVRGPACRRTTIPHRFGSTFGRTFGERGGLSFGGAFEFVDACLEPHDEIAKLLVLAKQLIVGRSVHADLDSDKTVSAVRNSCQLALKTSHLLALENQPF